jgi:hypothetical protein
MLERTGLFNTTSCNNIDEKHFPNTLYLHLVTLDLINQKQTLIPLRNQQSIQFKISEILKPNSLQPDAVSISITETFPSPHSNRNENKILTKKRVYSFTSKNALAFQKMDKEHIFHDEYNHEALLGMSNYFCKDITKRYVNEIITAIKRVELEPAQPDQACRCNIF